MEDNKKYDNINKNNFNQQISFSEYFYSDLDITPVLTESLEKMKKFISFVLEKLKNASEKKDDKSSLFLSGKVLDYINAHNEKLGIPFFYMLIKEEELKNIITNLFFDNIHIPKIKQLLEKIIDIFNFDFEKEEIKNYLYIFCNELISIGVIEKSDLKEKENRKSLTEEEDLFLLIESIIEHNLTIRGDNIEKDDKVHIESLISFSEDKFAILISNEALSKASIEFYDEKLKLIKDYKNNVNNNKFNINNLGENYIDNEDMYYDDDDEDDEQEKSPEEIAEDIKQLRKNPLKDRTYFYKQELIIEDENEYIEYKKYYFPLDNIHKMELERQMCAFLNSEGGRLYIGINDQKIVTGVKANLKLLYYENFILSLANNFSPKIEPKNYFKFYAIPVKNNENGKIINNLFVFKILIKKGEETKLYYVDDNKLNIAIRQDGQCANLKASEIYQKITERKNIKNKTNLIKDESFDMNDPAPLYNQKIKNNEIEKDNWRAPKRIKKKRKKKNLNIKKDKKDIKDKNLIEQINEIKIEEKASPFLPNKNKKSKKKNNHKGTFRVEVSNIDRKADEKELAEFFQSFNCKEKKIFTDQNGNKNAFLIFDNEKDTDNFIDTCLGLSAGDQNNNWKLKRFGC